MVTRSAVQPLARSRGRAASRWWHCSSPSCEKLLELPLVVHMQTSMTPTTAGGAA
jgi:hypothetical protein